MSDAPATIQAIGRFVPEFTYQVLPGCKNGHPHPMARKPAIDSDTCPDCGEKAGTPGPVIEQAAVLIEQ